MSKPSYEVPTVTIDANDAEFLAHLLKMYAVEKNQLENDHILNLHARLLGIMEGI